MKRLICIFAFAAVLTVAFSCKKEADKPVDEQVKGYLKEFSATIEEEFETKAQVVVSTGKVSFEDGDEVAVSNGTSVATYVYNSSTDKFTAKSEPLEQASAYRAYYPASGYVGAGENGSMKVSLPASQAYDAAAVLNAPMGAYSSDGNFLFKNLCAIVEFSMSSTETLTGVEFRANRSVSGDAVFSGTSSLSLETSASQPVTVTMDLSIIPDSTTPVCLVIPAGTYPGGITLTCTFNTGRKWVQTISRDIVIEAGVIHETDLLPVYFSGGRGTATNPYKIATVQDLLELSGYIASTADDMLPFRTAFYRQVADIDFAGGTLPSIGNSNAAEPYSFFNGTYEGNGFKVSNLVIDNPNSDKAHGFFGYLDGAAHIDGLALENATINSSTYNNGIIVGCVQGSSTVLIENCTVVGGSVTANNTDVGGLAGKMISGTMRNCSYSGSVMGTGSGKHRIGGIAGQMANACLVDDCYFDGTVTGACGNVGGIVGSMAGSASVTGCSTSATSVIEGGSVADNGINIGGIAGYITNATGGKVENCSFPGTVVGHYYEVGGIAGRDQGLVIRGCTFSGTVYTDWNESDTSNEQYARVGGICGHIHGTGYVENCQVSGSVGADAHRVCYVGGVVGWLEVGSIIDCSIASGKTLVVRGKNAIGGLVGQFKNGIVKSCTLNGVTVHASGNYAGGFIGRMMPNASMTNCALVNSTVTAGGMCAGGMCALFQTGGYIAQCAVSGSTITAGTKLAGGILGNMDSCTSALTSRVEKCTVEGGSVIASTQGIAGGILGGCNTYGIVNLCSASTNVYNNAPSGSYGNVGGIIGWTSTLNIVIANCVFYGGELHSDGGTGGGVAGICGQLNSNANDIGNTCVVNCCAFPSAVTSKAGNVAGIAGYVNTVTIRNCYSPTPGSTFLVDGGTTNSSRGSIYGWLRGKATGDACSGVLEDVYWLSGFKAGNFSGSYTYVKSEQSLTDAQMRGTGAVSRPSTGVAYGGFLEALNAAADDYNAGSPVFGVQAAEWVMGTNGYPVPFGTSLAGSSAVSSKKRVSLLGDSITTYQGYTTYPNNYEYPKESSYPDFTSVTQTWWYQLIYNRMSNATLEVNSSYTGTCVQNTTSTGHPGYGFLNRYVDLGNPDVIFINGGTNDISRGLPVGTLDFSIATDALDTYQFAQAYDKLIRLMKARYPSATICVVMGDRFFDGTSTAHAPVVREICSHYGIPYAEVDYGASRSTCRYSNGTNVHPTPEGMTAMADAVWAQLQSVL